jgi:hypothetical protein
MRIGRCLPFIVLMSPSLATAQVPAALAGTWCSVASQAVASQVR